MLGEYEPEWVKDAREALHEYAVKKREQAARKQASVIERASRSRSPLGRFLRSKHGKRFAAGKREVRYVSIPIDLDREIVAESADLGLSISRFLLVCIALGAAQWPTYRALLYDGPNGEEPIPKPKLVEYILQKAVNPDPRPQTPSPHIAAWQREVHKAVMQRAKEKKAKALDPTQSVLSGVGGGA
jgi:hypothetical protein